MSSEISGSKDYLVKVHRFNKEVIVAICDKDLFGRVIKHKEIEIRIDKPFYGGIECDEAQAIELIRSATIINGIGRKSIKLLKKLKLVEKVIYVGKEKIPHAQVIFI